MSDIELSLLQGVVADPQAAFVLADWLEENGRAEQGELLRLSYTLREPVGIERRDRNTKSGVVNYFHISAARRQLDTRLQELLASGVRPVVPTYINSVGMTFAWIPPGTFLMGSSSQEAGRQENVSRRLATLTRGFWLGVTPVTQAQWQSVTGANPSRFRGDDLPVESVSWEDCQAFCEKLTELDGRSYRLPSESEWEYACRAGTATAYHSGDGEEALRRAGWFMANADGKPHPVGLLEPNGWGFHDMHGTVWEWCADWYGDYPGGELKDYKGPQSGIYRVLRGGSWYDLPRSCRSAYRLRIEPDYRGNGCGVRLAFP